MARGIIASVVAVIACLIACTSAWCGRLYGEVTRVTENSITCSFPAEVKQGSAMIVMSGEGESVSGMAISQGCRGRGPYEVTGAIQWISDQANFQSGKTVYVDSLNASAIPSRLVVSGPSANAAPGRPTSNDLGLYYFASAQKVGAGPLGLGVEKVLDGGCGSSLELDAGVTGMAGLGVNKDNSGETGSLIENLSARLNVKMAPGGGLYSRYRWSKAKGSDEQWQAISRGLQGKTFAGPSNEDAGVVTLRGIEYGLAFNMSQKATLSLGYIPELLTDFGGIGVLEEPARTAEIRYGDSRRAIRIRGLSWTEYWVVDLGITIIK